MIRLFPTIVAFTILAILTRVTVDAYGVVVEMAANI